MVVVGVVVVVVVVVGAVVVAMVVVVVVGVAVAAVRTTGAGGAGGSSSLDDTHPIMATVPAIAAAPQISLLMIFIRLTIFPVVGFPPVRPRPVRPVAVTFGKPESFPAGRFGTFPVMVR